jgi:hypothetical protein
MNSNKDHDNDEEEEHDDKQSKADAAFCNAWLDVVGLASDFGTHYAHPFAHKEGLRASAR